MFYRYFDLSNEQMFYARKGRISADTAAQWKDGIVGNLSLPAFARAWAELQKDLPEQVFEDLRALVSQSIGPGSGGDHANRFSEGD